MPSGCLTPWLSEPSDPWVSCPRLAQQGHVLYDCCDFRLDQTAPTARTGSAPQVDTFSFGVLMYELLSRELLLVSYMNTSRAARLGIKRPADYAKLVS